EIKAVFNRFPTRELFYSDLPGLKRIIDHIVYMTGDDEIAVDTRKGVGYEAVAIAFTRARYSYTVEEQLRVALSEAFGPVTFCSSEDCGNVMLLLYYFDSERLERPLDVGEIRRLTASMVTRWEDQAEASLVKAFGERQGRRLFLRYVRNESRSGL